MVNIFDSAKEKVMPQWMKFTTAGDSVQGTYIGKITGQKDNYGNEQIIYQLLQEDGSVINVGFGLNKKFLNTDMESVKFGQIIGFRYKGTVDVKDKRSGKIVSVKDFSLHQDPKIVNDVWLKENAGNMPVAVKSTYVSKKAQDYAELDAFTATTTEDVPFSSTGSLTNEDKLAIIQKLAKDKLGATDLQSVKDKVMETTGIAFIPVNYDKISAALAAK